MSDISGATSTPSGMTGAGGGQLLRITGMATGLDVDAMVKKMMAAEQTKLDKAKQDQQIIQWKQVAYQDIIKDIKDLQSSFFDSSSSDKNILSSVNFSPYNVSGPGGTAVDTSVATLTPGVGVQTGTYSIIVNRLASGAGVSNSLVQTSATASPPSTKAALSTKLTDINSALTGNITLSLSVNGGTTPVNITLNNTGSSTLGDLVNAINNQSGGSVKAIYSELTGEFKLNTSKTGNTTSVTINSGTTTALSSILGNGYVLDNAINNGENANVTITPPGGSPVTGIEKTTNSFTIDGMSYNISSLSPFSSDNVNRIATSVNVGTDTQKVYDKIKSFIDKYNTIVDKIQTKLNERKDYNYKPLTDAQKQSMSDSQITVWETKAKAGILRGDNNLENMLNGLRTAFITPVNNTGLSFGSYGSNSFGIDTSTDYEKPAHINIVDSSKLKDAITNKSNQVLKIFTNVSGIAADSKIPYNSSSTKYQEDGVFTRVKSILETNVGFTNTTLNSALLTSYTNKQYDYSSTGTGGKGTIPDQLYEQQLMIKKITDSMNTKQEKYYQQFSQLETAMNTLNVQQAQLSSLLGQ